MLITIIFLEPPPDVMNALFPWVEKEEALLAERLVKYGKIAKDESLVYFLSLLKYLRLVLAQDAAVLASTYPGLPVFNFAPFNTLSFRSFSQSSVDIIQKTEETVRENLKNLPEHYATSLDGLMKTALIKQEQHQMQLEQSNARMLAEMNKMKEVFKASLALQSSKSSSRGLKRKAVEDLGSLIGTLIDITNFLRIN